MPLPPHLDGTILARLTGSVVETTGLTAALAGMPAPVGAIVGIGRGVGGEVEAEVIGFRGELTLAIPLASMEGVRRGSPVRLVSTSRTLRVGPALLGRVLDARGRAIDGRPQPLAAERAALEAPPTPATQRPRIDAPLGSGVRAIDGMLTCGRGQRLGIFAGSGVGKSVLMGMMARYTAADVAVIALIGERGREVNEFIERELGPEGLAKSVVVVATSNEPAPLRVRAAYAATTIAEH
ncbi:MAG TPA: EscN/YscN/HrcN family type III secretion system ATPase, partial [Lacipirellulaceae bacterium]|nr:EscN/YscN/HrcN family type III secretion system ATPase [Lacipirellulaceae bacterium]